MTAKNFICPTGSIVPISACLMACPHKTRCMASPTINVLAGSCADRGLEKFSVTELIRGTRESFLLKTKDYDIDPQSLLFAAHGTAMHALNEASSKNIIVELRLENDIATGQIDAYGDVLGDGRNILLDYKVTSSYKAMKALGYYSVDEPTGEFYKSGLKKGQMRCRKKWLEDGRRDVFEWALQTNFYRMLLEEHGYKVDGICIQMYVRDFSLRMATERNVTRTVYILPINKISDHWLRKWFRIKLERLQAALKNNELPPPCKARETWHGNKCRSYCSVADHCPVGRHYRSIT